MRIHDLTYEHDGLPGAPDAESTLVQTEVPIYGASRLGTYHSLQDGSTTYEITDHLGNVRALVRDNIMSYTATMEDNNQEDISNPRVEEMQYFENLFETEYEYAPMNHSQPVPGIVSTPNKSAYLYWEDGMTGMEAADKSVGPAIAIKVNAGDKVDIETWARFERKETFLRGFLLPVLSAFLGNAFATKGIFEGLSAGQVGVNLDNALSALAYPDGAAEGGIPFAYLNYIIYDENMVPVTADWKPVSDAAGFDANEMGLYGQHEHLTFPAPVEIAQNGYIYVWVSNQSPAAKVWFDDLKVEVTQNLVVQATDYGVWGEVLREQRTDESVYRYGYQGQFSEKDDETGWNHFELREYDPVIGRTITTDPAQQFHSPYMWVGNNPIIGTDPTGGISPTMTLMATSWEPMIKDYKVKQSLCMQVSLRKECHTQVHLKPASHLANFISLI